MRRSLSIRASTPAAVVAELYRRDVSTQTFGIELVDAGPGRAVVSMVVRPDMCNGYDVCHGGMTFTLADTAMAFASGSHNQTALAAAASIDFLSPVPRGSLLRATAEERWLKGRTGLYDVRVELEDGTLVAVFHGRTVRAGGQVVDTGDRHGQRDRHGRWRMNRWASIDDFQSFIDDGGIVEADDAMSDEYRAEVFKFIELHANSELMGGLTERDWIPRAPGLRRKMGVLAKTQDEIGHAHLLYMVAADLGVKTRRQMLEDLFAGRSRFHNVFHYAAVTWGDQVAIAYLVDAAALISQQAVFKNCSYGPYRRILRRIIAEEGFHMRHGEEMLLTIAEGTPTQHDLFQEALDRWWLPALQLFGPDSKPDDELMRFRIKSEPNEVLRDRWVQKYAPLLTGYGFTIPDPDLRHDPDTGRWEIGPIDWSHLKATLDNAGPDSARRIGNAARHWSDTEWVRDALDAVASEAA